jgi:hypothetical protein
MSRLRPVLSALLVLAAFGGWPAGAWGQTFPSDDAGRPAPWCSYIDDSVTPNVSVPCSITHPLPSGPAGASIATDIFGYGRAYFFGITGLQGGAQPQPAPAITLFTDAVTVVGLRQGTAGAALVAYNSTDGGRTFAPGVPTGFPAAGGANNPKSLIRTVSPTPRFVIAVSGNAGGSVAHSVSIGSGWAFSTGIPLANATFYGLASQASAVLAVGPNAANNATVACLSTNDGQDFPTCVTVDAAGASKPAGVSNPVVATPALNIWVTLLANGKIWRSADNGATWTTVATLAAGQGTIFCVSSTRCIAVANASVFQSNDAGLTWTQTATLPGATFTAFTICPYNATTFDILGVAGWPTSATGVTVPAYRTIDGGTVFLGAPVTGGTSALSNPVALSGACSTTAGGRTSLVVSSAGFLFTYYGTLFQNIVEIVGANGVPLNVDANGNVTANQGVPAASSANAWGVVPVQGQNLKNSHTTGAAATAVVVTIAGVASQQVHVYSLEARCNTAADTTTGVTLTDGGTTKWSTGPTDVPAASVNYGRPWVPGYTAASGATVVITLAACSVGTGTLIVQADQF